MKSGMLQLEPHSTTKAGLRPPVEPTEVRGHLRACLQAPSRVCRAKIESPGKMLVLQGQN